MNTVLTPCTIHPDTPDRSCEWCRDHQAKRRSTPRNLQTPLAAYQAEHRHVMQQLADLQSKLQVNDTDRITWAHVGDLTHVSKQLTELQQFLGNHQARHRQR